MWLLFRLAKPQMSSTKNKISSVTSKDGSRKYTGKSGRSYFSVTTILGKVENKAWLKEWKENNPDSHKLSQRYSSTGTRVHSLNEEYILNSGTVDFSRYEQDEKIPTDIVEEIKARHQAYVPFLNITSPICVEEKLIWEESLSHGEWIGYGGSCDYVCKINQPHLLQHSYKLDGVEVTEDIFKPDDNVIAIVDWKNWRSAKTSQNLIKNYCQLAAYAAAKNQSLAPENYIKHGIIAGTTCSEKKKQSRLYLFYIDLELMEFYFGWFHHFMLYVYGVKTKEQVNWNLFKEIACGYQKVGEDENNKAIWGKRERDYLGKKLILNV
jgi:hypothetical protein